MVILLKGMLQTTESSVEKYVLQLKEQRKKGEKRDSNGGNFKGNIVY
jgi:hypothetical protein